LATDKAQEETEMASWVRRLHEIGDKMDETALSMHPSAWHEALKQDREKWQKVAAENPESDSNLVRQGVRRAGAVGGGC
jgi:hypothetical protein